MRAIDADALLDEVMDRHCNDCDRRKGIKNGKYRIIYSIGEAPCRACDVDDLKGEIEDAPTIEPEPHWTFCKERMPKKTGWYAVIDDSGGAKFVETSYYREEDELNPFWEFVNPVAWMSIELPEPYREGENDSD